MDHSITRWARHTANQDTVSVERGASRASRLRESEREPFLFGVNRNPYHMDRVRRRHCLSQCTLHSRVVLHRDAAVTPPVAVVGLQSAEAAAADPLRRIHRKNRSVKLYWIFQNT